MSFIYKITNKINDKVYIGYTSRTPDRRFYEHTWEAENRIDEDSSCLHKAMNKYGINSFTIEVIEEFSEDEKDWQELEKFYIQQYNSLVPNGYNILIGGDKPPVRYGDKNNKTKLSDEKLQELYMDLRDTTIPYQTLSEKYGLSLSQLGRINNGTARFHPEETYPIRKYNQNELYTLEVMHLLATNNSLTNEEIAKTIPNYFRSNEIASINNGKKYAYLWDGTFPIRSLRVPKDYKERQNIAKKVINYIENCKKNNLPIIKKEIQKNLIVSREVLDKIIKGQYPYNLEGMNYPILLK